MEAGPFNLEFLRGLILNHTQSKFKSAAGLELALDAAAQDLMRGDPLAVKAALLLAMSAVDACDPKETVNRLAASETQPALPRKAPARTGAIRVADAA